MGLAFQRFPLTVARRPSIPIAAMRCMHGIHEEVMHPTPMVYTGCITFKHSKYRAHHDTLIHHEIHSTSILGIPCHTDCALVDR